MQFRRPRRPPRPGRPTSPGGSRAGPWPSGATTPRGAPAARRRAGGDAAPRHLVTPPGGRHRRRGRPLQRGLLPALPLQGRTGRGAARGRHRAAGGLSGAPDGQEPHTGGPGAPLGRGRPVPGRRRHRAATLAVLWNGGGAGGGRRRSALRGSAAGALLHRRSRSRSRWPSSMRLWPPTPRSACSRTTFGAAHRPAAARPTASSTSASAPSPADPRKATTTRRRTRRSGLSYCSGLVAQAFGDPVGLPLLHERPHSLTRFGRLPSAPNIVW